MLWAMGYEYDEWAKLGGLTWSRSAKSLKRVSAERRRKETEMEEYPEELRTPPVSLVSLVGFAQHHHLISTHLLSHQPPINTLALPDLSKLLLLLPKSNKPPLPVDSQPQGQAGILKRDWLVKHRTRIPSVVAPLFSSDQLSGDPTKWLQVCSDLDNLKAVIRPRNIKFLLIIILKDGDDINEDRFLALRRRAELDAKYILTFNPDDASQLQHSLNRHAALYLFFLFQVIVTSITLSSKHFSLGWGALLRNWQTFITGTKEKGLKRESKRRASILLISIFVLASKYEFLLSFKSFH